MAGAIPLLRPLRESLAGDEVRRVLGIVNGTTNFILDRMDTSGADFSAALAEAQALGYAEADPTADVAGFDAASKAAILASIAFHTEVTADDVYREGITVGHRGRHRQREGAGLRGQAAGHLRALQRRDLGPGAPGDDPADAPAGRRARGLQRGLRRGRVGRAADVLRRRARAASRPPARSSATSSPIARNLLAGLRGPDSSTYAAAAAGARSATRSTRYYVQLDVADRPGVLAPVADAFAQQGVSIKAVRQEGRGDDANLMIMTHTAREAALAKTVAVLERHGGGARTSTA